MIRVNTHGRIIGVLALILLLFSGNISAGQETPMFLPASNASPEVDCSVYSNNGSVTQKTIASVLEAARQSLNSFLLQVQPGKEDLFGFSGRAEMAKAVIIDTPYQLYARCQGTDYPTDRWRVPYALSGVMKGFIGVELVNSTWKAVDFGGKELADAIEKIEKSSYNAAPSGSSEIVHRIVVRDFQNRTDRILLESSADLDKSHSMASLDFPEVIQEQNQWCWAGVSASLFDYFDSRVEQCEIAEYVRQVATWHDFGSIDCCINPGDDCNYWNYNWGYSGSIEDILENMQNRIGILNYGVSRVLTIPEVEDDLANDLPSVIRWGWNSGGGHFVAVFGLDENENDASDPYVHYMDPWFGEGNKIALFSWMESGGTHTWTHTNRITRVERHGDTDGSKHLGLADVIFSLKIVSNMSTTTPNLSADVDSDTKIGIAEAIYTLNDIAGITE
jgi:hypothetical protein